MCHDDDQEKHEPIRDVDGNVAALVLDLDRYIRNYGLMILQGHPLPAQAAGDLAKIMADARQLSQKTLSIVHLTVSE